jgi:hypothetical protein
MGVTLGKLFEMQILYTHLWFTELEKLEVGHTNLLLTSPLGDSNAQKSLRFTT